MGIVNYTYNRSTSGGEIITHLINASDGEGLHFDGAASTQIDIPTVPDLGTKFSFEFIVQADSWGDSKYICDFGTGGRFSFAAWGDTSYNLAVYDNGFRSFGVKVLDDLKVHHLVMTVDGTAAILYDNGNQVGTVTLGQTPNIDNCTDAAIGSYISGTTGNFDGTIYRARFWNKTLSQAEVTASYENATVPFSDQYSSTASPLMAGTLTSGKLYRIITYVSGDDFTNLGGTNVTGNEFVTTGTTPTTWSNGSSLIQIGCTADYDLSFSNPTQSLMVQDRANIADGTSSATGVVQVTPIEQLNAKAARIGTSAATPADGEIISGKLKLDAANTDPPAGWTGNSQLLIGSGNRQVAIARDTDGDNAYITSYEDSVGYKNLVLQGVGGNVGIGCTPAAPLQVAASPSDTVGVVGISLKDVDNAIEFGLRLDAASKDLHIDRYYSGAWYGPVMTFDRSSGNVGIGVAPSAALDVETSSVVWAAEIRQTNVSNGDGLFVNTGSTASADYVASFRANDVNIFDIKSNGAINAAGLVTCATGVVETGGVLKSNLLTNSGFDVWSNSTLEDVGSDLSTNGTFASDTGWTKETGWTISGGNAVATNVADGDQMWQTVTGLTVGKLYQLTVNVNGYTDGSVAVRNSTLGVESAALSGTGSATVVFEAAATSNNIAILARTASTDLTVAYVTLFEVVPGCVAADQLAPDGWFKDTTLDIYREHSGSNTKDGSFYSLKGVVNGASDFLIWPDTTTRNSGPWLDRFAGRTVTFGAWVKTSTATHMRLNIYDGGDNWSGYHTGGGAWEWIEVTTTISASPTYVQFEFKATQASGDYYVSQPMLVFGSAIGSGNYSAPSGEVVWCEKAFSSNSLYANGFSDVADTTMNLEADTNGKFPKGAKAFMFAGEIRDSASSTSDGYLFFRRDTAGYVAAWVSPAGLANDEYARASGTSPCDANGDYSYKIEASGSATTDVYLNYSGVQLR